MNRKYKSIKVADLFSSPCSKNNLQKLTHKFQAAVKGGMHEKRQGEKRGKITNGLLCVRLQEFHPCIPSLCPTVLKESRLSMLSRSIIYELNIKKTCTDQHECTKNTYRAVGALQPKA